MVRSRRTVLRLGLLGSVGLPGCMAERDDETFSTNGDKTPTTTDEKMPTEIQFWLEEVTLSESERAAIEPIVFGDLSNGQQDIVQTALEKGEYTSEIGDESSALKGLRRRISARTGGGIRAYLRRDETTYRVGFVSGDHIIASPS